MRTLAVAVALDLAVSLILYVAGFCLGLAVICFIRAFTERKGR